MGDVARELKRYTVPARIGSGDLAVLPQAAAAEVEVRLGLSRKELERAALAAGIVPGRYLRNIGTLGLAGQRRLHEATVAVIGCGGLGGLVVELLARMGVGCLVLVDGDVFEDNNLNRQLLCTEADLGKPKVMAACARVLAVNPAVEVRCFQERLEADNAAHLLAGADVAVDALDNLPSRFVLEEATRKLGIPLVHGAIAGFLGQVLTIFPGDPGLAEIYGPPGTRERGIEIETGNPAATPALVASLQVQEVVKILTGVGEPLRGRLLYVDSAGGEVHTLRLGAETKSEKSRANRPVALSFVGASGSGKTTLLVTVIKELVRRGLKVAALKHTHKPVEVDLEGKDTWRFRAAGASGAALVGDERAAVFYDLPAAEPTARLKDWFPEADLVLVEGFKRGPSPKVVVFRQGVSEPLIPPPEGILAIYGDVAAARSAGLPGDVPGFSWGEEEKLSDFITSTFQLPPRWKE